MVSEPHTTEFTRFNTPDKSILAAAAFAVLYALLRLADEFVVILDEVVQVTGFWTGGVIRMVHDITMGVFGMDLESVVLSLFAIFLIIAIFDYLSKEW